MKSLITGDKATVARLAERLKHANCHSQYQRIQCVLIRATLGSSASEIVQLLGWSTATVQVLHSRWAKEGDTIFNLRARGGRHHQHLNAQQEQDLLALFAERAQAGGVLTVSEIQQAYKHKWARWWSPRRSTDSLTATAGATTISSGRRCCSSRLSSCCARYCVPW